MSNPHPYDRLTPDKVIDAVESCGLLSDARILALNSYENRVYQVGIEEGTPIIAKFYRPGRWSQAQIMEEHRFTQQLADLELSVVPPTANENGETLHHFDGFDIALFRRQGGHAPELDNLDNLYTLGQMMGRIHACGASEDFAHRPSIDISSYGHKPSQFLLENNFIPKSLIPSYESLARDLLAKIEEIWKACGDQPQIRLHGDCHGGNILWRDNQPHFVDFDDARMGPAIQDLWMFLTGGDRNEQSRQLSELVEGYNEFYELPLSQLRLIEVMRSLRLIHYNGWLASRWDDPAFPHSFSWFNTERYWSEHILELREQFALLQEDPLKLF